MGSTYKESYKDCKTVIMIPVHIELKIITCPFNNSLKGGVWLSVLSQSIVEFSPSTLSEITVTLP